MPSNPDPTTWSHQELLQEYRVTLRQLETVEQMFLQSQADLTELRTSIRVIEEVRKHATSTIRTLDSHQVLAD